MVENYFREYPLGLIISVAALIALLVPRRLLKPKLASRRVARVGSDGKKVFKQRSFDERQADDQPISIREVLSQRITWIDFLRGLFGAHALMHYGLSFEWVESRTTAGIYSAGIFVGVAWIATLVPMIRKMGGRVRFVVPTSLILGMSMGYLHLGDDRYGRLFLLMGLALGLLLATKPLVTGPGMALLVFVLSWFGVCYFFVGLIGQSFALPVAALVAGFPIILHLTTRVPMHFEAPLPSLKSDRARLPKRA
jgi:hypothetical protein